MSRFSELSRNAIRSIVPYEPGKPISEVQREYGIKDVVKLASNENPLGSSPKAIEAVKNALNECHLYPDGGGYYLKTKLQNLHGLTEGQLVLGNGSAELIELVTEAFVDPGDEVVICREEFFKYRIAVQIMNGKVIWAKMPDLYYDVNSILEKISSKTKLIFIANPNNPTGTLMDKKQVSELMDKIPPSVMVVFDEAYYDFRDNEVYPDISSFLSDGRNVIILRTFSKSYGLAGFRIGYAISSEKICHAMNAVREAFNVNSLGLIAAEAALDDEEFLKRTIRNNEDGKNYFYKELKRLKLDFLPTHANFVLIKMPIPGREIFQKLLKKGVVVRPVDNYGLSDYIRVSIGLPEENRRFFRELSLVL